MLCLQDIQDSCSKIAQELRLQVPMQVSAQTNETSPVYASLVEAALNPVKHIPETPTLRVWLAAAAADLAVLVLCT